MKEQKVYLTPNDFYATDVEKEINKILSEGWMIVSVTAQNISNSTTSSSCRFGGYLIVFECKLKYNKDNNK